VGVDGVAGFVGWPHGDTAGDAVPKADPAVGFDD
jgi:hypothetical protein